jgi:hypothetical protein
MSDQFACGTLDSLLRDEIVTKRNEFDRWAEEQIRNFSVQKENHNRAIEKLQCMNFYYSFELSLFVDLL